MKVAVTGASGHVGSALVRLLLEQGHDVSVLLRKNSASIEGLPVRRFSGDIQDAASLPAFLEGAQRVFHCAANISVTGVSEADLARTNVDGAVNVAQACLHAGVERLVHFSSIHAFSEHPMSQPLRESNGLLRPDEAGALPYSRTKARGQAAVLNLVKEGLDVVVVNPGSCVGPWDFSLSHVGEVIRDLARGTMPGLVRGGYDFVDTRDVALGAVAAAEKGRTGEAYLLTGHHVSIVELADLVASVSGKPRPRFVCPMWLAYAAAPFSVGIARLTGHRPRFSIQSLRVLNGNTHSDHSKAAAELGYAPRPLPETLTDTVAWQKEAGWL